MPSKRNHKQVDPSEENKLFAMYIAMVIRNAMEDFHVKHLSDRQVKELNPIIRNAVYTALYTSDNYEKSMAANNLLILISD
jgi:hypothetical protein